MRPEDRDYDESREERKARKARERAVKRKILMIISTIVIVLAVIIVLVLVVLLKGRIDAENNQIDSEAVTSLSMTYVGEKTVFDSSDENVTSASSADSSNSAEDLGPVPTIDTSTLSSPDVYMIRVKDNAQVIDQNGTARIYPASMTKIMTVLVAIENIDDLSATYTFDGTEFNTAYAQGAATAGFEAGETVPILDILYGIMLPSGADACYAICNYVSGSEADFVTLMNQKAQEIGMTATNFANATGLQDENHYSTCQDMAKLLEYAVKNETFKTIFSTHIYTTKATSVHSAGIALSSTTFRNLASSTLDNGTTIIGGKTGYTDEAGHCLASLAADANGVEYILVTAGAAGDANATPHITDAETVYSQLPSA
ncbi:MAG: D-alanyl-D-alanine carboxypeptidase family protein [Bilifractor sp.]|jgi:D-alanyl-D-alanine carboxypeptidase (penicillin-binding protein 5/6)